MKKAPVFLPEANIAYTTDQIAGLIEQIGLIAERNILLQEEIRLLQPKAQTAQILNSLIKPYANRTFWFMVGYCGFVGAVLVGAGAKQDYFSVDPDVLKILVGSTAVTVIGLVGMILTGVFVGARKY
ncbi:hypothetical protein [Methylobacterium sp. J-068]|uniref:hypothetical protein n=1 Tax=Methylobacterium sp. J-068 TaxID=2836649 RepID=UPI001FB88D57|nr:hypothetical protein [Methylobacterium sp. J-068]MCJ2033151.1 hypothetical protein [Methylobacterium sp. J-068]